jgi:UDP-N-acetylmuramoylalanine--D-glutamate ligase
MRILGKGKTAQAIQEVYPDAKLYDDNDHENFDCNSSELTIVSPGIPPYNYLVQNTKNIQSDYDLFLTPDKFTIWISGTNGKTTTTGMIYHLLKEEGFFCGGNIGTPLANIAHEKKLILETSSFTLHYTNKAKPNIYILLPISEDHISWHGSFREYEDSKLKPLQWMGKDDIAIVPSKYKEFQTDAKLYTYKQTEDIAVQFDIDIKKIKFKEPFLQDATLALIAAKLVNGKLSYEKINSFIQDPHKLEEFQDNKGNVWVDDSKATNIDATIQALKSYKDKNINLIIGGDDKGVDLDPLFQQMKQYSITLFAIGSNTQKILDLAKHYDKEVIGCFTLEKAVKQIIQNKKFHIKSSINMLSPAAASLDQFSSYKHRGEVFKKVVSENF